MANKPVRIGGVLYPSQEWYDSHHGGGTPAPVTPPTPVAPVPSATPAPAPVSPTPTPVAPTIPPPAVAPAPVAPTTPQTPAPAPSTSGRVESGPFQGMSTHNNTGVANVPVKTPEGSFMMINGLEADTFIANGGGVKVDLSGNPVSSTPTTTPASPVQPTPAPVAPNGLPAAGRLPFPQTTAEMEAYQARQAAGEITFNGTDWVYTTSPEPTTPQAPAPAPIASTPVPTPAPTAPTPTSTYQIASGDTLSEIATKNGTTVDAIMAANPQITDPNQIFAGQSLNLPANGEAPILPTAPAGEAPPTTTEPVETVEELQDQSIDEIVNNALEEFGVDLAAQDWLNFPEFSFENVISDLLEGMGWMDLQSNIIAIQEELDTATKNRDEAVGTIRENPWLDQSMQLGRIGRTQDKAQAEITRLQNKLTLATNTAIRVEEKAEIYAAKALTQYSSEKEYAKDKYDYLLQRAKTDIEAKLAERAEIKAEEQFRYTEANKPLSASEKSALIEEEEITRVRNALTNFEQRDYVSKGYYNQVKAGSTLSPTEFDNRFDYLLKDGETSDFTETEEKKLEQAGLTNASRQEQLDHLYGGSDSFFDNL